MSHTLLSRPLAVACLATILATTLTATQFTSTTRVVPVYATVTDANGLVAGLTAADFEISENGVRRAITVFKTDIEPINIAVLLDTSPSLFPVAGRSAAAVVEFAKRLLPADRAIIGTFSHVVSLDPALSGDVGVLLKRLDAPAPWPAGTAIWDAIEAGRSALDNEGGRRVVLIVSDGADNASRIDPDDVRSKLQREGVMVYAIGLRGRFGIDTTEMGALANATGGRAIELKGADDIASTMGAIADELHHQYVLGFSPEKLDDKVHRLDVKVKRPGVTVRARRTFVASKAEAR